MRELRQIKVVGVLMTMLTHKEDAQCYLFLLTKLPKSSF